MTNDESIFHTLEKIKESVKIANGDYMEATCIRTIAIHPRRVINHR